MGVVVYGHYGPPMIAFPTTGGDEWEYERQGVIGAMARAIDGGRVKVFCVNTNNSDSFGNERRAPAPSQLHAGACTTTTSSEEVLPVRPRATAAATTSACGRWGRRSAATTRPIRC